MKEKILILGGAGYIGSHVNYFLNQQGYETVVFDSLVYGHEEFVKWGTFIKGDLADIEEIREVFSRYKIKAVMHFAAFAYVGESVQDPEKYYFNNVVNTLNLLKVMKEFEVKSLVFSSTCATYGSPVYESIDEGHPQKPINPYGESKLMVEKILRDYHSAYGINYVALRYFNAAGALDTGEIGEWHDPETHLIPLVLKATAGDFELKVFGSDYDTHDGTCIRDYIHVMDLVDAHVKAMNYILSTNQSDVFNLANGQGFSVMEIIKAAEEVTGRKVKYVFADRREGDPAKLVGDSSKANKILKWQPQYDDIKEIISTAWKWELKKNSNLTAKSKL